MVFHSSLVVSPLPNVTDASCIRVIDGTKVVLAKDTTLLRLLDPDHPLQASATATATSDLLGPLLSKQFTFDRVYDQSGFELHAASAQSRQEELYARSIRSVVRQAIEGKNVCVLAYGASNSHKSIQIAGDEHSRGLIGLTLEELFTYAEQRSDNTQLFQLAVTLVHIHNDILKDLFYFDGSPLKIVTDETGTHIAGARRVRIKTREQIAEILRIFRSSSQQQQQDGASAGSNMHTILTIHLEHLDLNLVAELSRRGQQNQLPQCINLVSKIQIVDLASAEFALAATPSPNGSRAASQASTMQFPSAHPLMPSALNNPLIRNQANRFARETTLVKQAQLALAQKRREFIQASHYETRNIATGTLHNGAREKFNHPVYVTSPAASLEIEQKSISKALECLEHVLFQLSEKQLRAAEDSEQQQRLPTSEAEEAAKNHISYRANKLTWILADTLRISNGNEVFLLNFVSPDVRHMDSTMPVLRFGSKVGTWFREKEISLARKQQRLQQQARGVNRATTATTLRRSALQATKGDTRKAGSVLLDATRSQKLLARHYSGNNNHAAALNKATAASTPAYTHEYEEKEALIEDTLPRQFLQSRSGYSPPSTTSQHTAHNNAPVSIAPSSAAGAEQRKVREEAARQHTGLEQEEKKYPSQKETHQPLSTAPHQHASEPVRRDIQPRNASSSTISDQSAASTPLSFNSFNQPQSSSPPAAAYNSQTSDASSLQFFSPTTDPANNAVPSRLFDVLELLKHAKISPGRGEEPQASWPYHKDVILAELTDQLTAWQLGITDPVAAAQAKPSERKPARPTTTSTSPKQNQHLQQQLDSLAGQYGDAIPVEVLRKVLAAPAAATQQRTTAASPVQVTSPPQTQTYRPVTTPQVPIPEPPSSVPAAPAAVVEATSIPEQNAAHAPMQPKQPPASHDVWLQEQMSRVKSEMSQLHQQLMTLSSQLPVHSEMPQKLHQYSTQPQSQQHLYQQQIPQQQTPEALPLISYASPAQGGSYNYIPSSVSPAAYGNNSVSLPVAASSAATSADNILVDPVARHSANVSTYATFADPAGNVTRFTLRPSNAPEEDDDAEAHLSSPPVPYQSAMLTPATMQQQGFVAALPFSPPPFSANPKRSNHPPQQSSSSSQQQGPLTTSSFSTPPSRPWFDHKMHEVLHEKAALESTLLAAEDMVKRMAEAARRKSFEPVATATVPAANQ